MTATLPPDLSISIVNTSNWVFLKPCLESIKKNVSGVTYEVLVVDNLSGDGSPQLIRTLFPWVILSENTRRLGFAMNNNINLKQATGRYLMLLNDDTLIQPASLEAAIAYLDSHPNVAAIGCKMVNPDGSYQVASARKFRTLWREFLVETGLNRDVEYIHMDNDSHEITPIPLDYPSEAGFLFRKEAMERVGLLDERFFMYGEGADWFKRLKQTGYHAEYFPGCEIIHFGGETNRRQKTGMHLQYYKSKFLWFDKHSPLGGQPYRWMILFLFTLKKMFRSLEHTFVPPNKKPLLQETILYYNALLDMFRHRVADPNYPYPIN